MGGVGGLGLEFWGWEKSLRKIFCWEAVSVALMLASLNFDVKLEMKTFEWRDLKEVWLQGVSTERWPAVGSVFKRERDALMLR